MRLAIASLILASLYTTLATAQTNIVEICLDPNFGSECQSFIGFPSNSCQELQAPFFKNISSIETFSSVSSCNLFLNAGCADHAFLIMNTASISDLSTVLWDKFIASFSCS